MLWVRSRSIEVYLSPTTVGCRGLDDSGDRWAQVASLEDGMAQLKEWLADSTTPVRARVWLGSCLARPFVISANSGARNTGEARELAGAMASDASGLEGDLKVWLAPWRAASATLAVAIPQSLHASLVALIGARKGQRVTSIRPWWNQYLDDVIERSRASASSIGWTVAEPDGLVQGRIVSGDVVEAAFEPPRTLDPDAVLIRRRLSIGWGELDEIEHLVFRPGANTAAQYAIGGPDPVRLAEDVA